MKLDLLNSRIKPIKSNLVNDSIEGNYINNPTYTNAFAGISRISFNSTYERTDYMKFSEAPNRFSDTKIDHRGNVVDVANQLAPKAKVINGRVQSTFGVDYVDHDLPKRERNKDEPYLPTLEKIKDKLYSPQYETVASRVQKGNLPGAKWSEAERHQERRADYTGSDMLDRYAHERGKHGLTQLSVKFSEVKTGRGELAPREDAPPVDKNTLPIQIRRRMDRVEKAEREKEARIIERKLKTSSSYADMSVEDFKSTYGGIADTTRRPESPARQGTGTIKFNGVDRFNNSFYSQETYVKTGGMLLDQDWDRRLETKLQLGFNKGNTPLMTPGGGRSESSNVDVDVGWMFSTGHAVAKSPVRYSSAFRSKAPVGMEIRPTTSPDHIGPGSFAHALPTAIQIKRPDLNSHFLLRDRKMPTRRAGPELTQPYPPFAEMHTAGPIFTQEGKSSGNVVLQKIVRDKMTQIYPKLAEKHFPPQKIKKARRSGKIK